MTVITGLFESSIFPSCVCRYQGFSGDPRVIPTLVAYKGTHFSVYNIKMLRKNLSTEHTEGTEITEKNYSILPCKSLTRIFNFGFLSWFLFRFTIGYFSRDSAKYKFLDLFSALTAPKIRASPMRSIFKSSPEARYSSVFSVEIFVLDFPSSP